ncbi:MAG: DUF5700 domain-containing putative Zn-dependent protease [Clostridium sp.]
MEISINYSTILPMLDICNKIKTGSFCNDDINNILEADDYIFEFSRYSEKITKEEFIDYLTHVTNINDDDIKNISLKMHHSNYKDLFNNLDFYYEKAKQLPTLLKKEVFQQQIVLASKGLPSDINLDRLKFIFTIGIGPSFGYVYDNCMHFDFLHLCRDTSVEELCSSLAHEIHHIGMGKILDKINMDKMSLEEIFYLHFAGEGLAVKYCNNAEGVISRHIYNDYINLGLDKFTWDYLNNDFDNTFNRFKKVITDIRSGSIQTQNDLMKELQDYWMTLYISKSNSSNIPELKHFRLYSFGNDIWGIIHDCYGKDVVFDTLSNINKFPDIYNSAVSKIGRYDLVI